MIFLNATTKSIEVKIGGAVTSNELTFVASWVDINQSTIAVTAMSEGDGVTTGATAVSVVAAPGASTTRQVKGLSVQNTDTVTQTVTVQVNNNTTKRPIIVQSLTAGQTLLYDEQNGWTIAPLATNQGPTGATGATGAAGAVGNIGPPGSGGDDDGADALFPQGLTSPVSTALQDFTPWTTFTPTWTPASGSLTVGTLTTARYAIHGKVMFVSVYFNDFTLSQSTANIVMTVPAGKSVPSQTQQVAIANNNGTYQDGTVVANGTGLTFYTNVPGNVNWAAETANSGIFYNNFFEIS